MQKKSTEDVKYLSREHLEMYDAYVMLPSTRFFTYANESKIYSRNVLHSIVEMHVSLCKLRKLLTSHTEPLFDANRYLPYGTTPAYSANELADYGISTATTTTEAPNQPVWTLSDRAFLYAVERIQFGKPFPELDDALKQTDHEQWLGAALYASIVSGLQRVYMFSLFCAQHREGANEFFETCQYTQQVFGTALGDVLEWRLYEMYDPGLIETDISSVRNPVDQRDYEQIGLFVREIIPMYDAQPYAKMLQLRKRRREKESVGVSQTTNWTPDDAKLVLRNHTYAMPIEMFREMVSEQFEKKVPLTWNEMVRSYISEPLYEHDWKNRMGKKLQICIAYAPVMATYRANERVAAAAKAAKAAKTAKTAKTAKSVADIEEEMKKVAPTPRAAKIAAEMINSMRNHTF